MNLITIKEAATRLDVSPHHLKTRISKAGVQLIKGPSFGRGHMQFVDESALPRIQQTIEEENRKFAELGKSTRIIATAPLMAAVEEINAKLDKLLQIWGQR